MVTIANMIVAVNSKPYTVISNSDGEVEYLPQWTNKEVELHISQGDVDVQLDLNPDGGDNLRASYVVRFSADDGEGSDKLGALDPSTLTASDFELQVDDGGTWIFDNLLVVIQDGDGLWRMPVGVIDGNTILSDGSNPMYQGAPNTYEPDEIVVVPNPA